MYVLLLWYVSMYELRYVSMYELRYVSMYKLWYVTFKHTYGRVPNVRRLQAVGTPVERQQLSNHFPSPRKGGQTPVFLVGQPRGSPAWLAELLLLSGDVETIPGPRRKQKTLVPLDLWNDPVGAAGLLARWDAVLA
jgi:hypothetical protein